MGRILSVLRRWADSAEFLIMAAVLFIVGTPVLILALVQQPVPPAAPPAPTVPPLPSPCAQLVVIDSDPVTLVCVPAEQAG